MSEVMWYLTRSSGIVALVLVLVAVADGLVFSGREGHRPRPAWWLDMHRGLGGYALIFTGLHVVTAFAASDLGVGLAQVFVPGTAAVSTTAFTWGVLALYGMLVTVFSTWPRRLLRRGAWHALHLLSIPAAVAAAVHAYQLGTDARTPAYTLLLLALVALATYPLGLRLSGIVRRRLQRTRPPVPTGVAR
jgi:DMSO/TMAO reductase YedYZ heme-binding membrane subunit